MTVVVDASVALKWVLQEEDTEDALRLWDRWQDVSERVCAPPVFRGEVTNALHQATRRGLIDPIDAADALGLLIPIVAIEEPEGLYDRALALAGQLSLGSTYDSLYIAVAESQGCDLWTADRRFVRSLRGLFPQVRWTGDGGSR